MRRLSPVFCLPFLLLFAGCPAPREGEVNWLVMGTNAHVKWSASVDSPLSESPRRVRETFARIEKLLNAHDPASELSHLAPLSDVEVLEKCSPEVRPCLAAAFRLRDLTGSAFNPRWRGTKTLDLGAIAKGFAVDRAIEGWIGCGAKGRWRILVDLGGNLRAAGTDGWQVGVKDGDAFTLGPGEACATSAAYYRGGHIRDGRTGNVVSNGIHSVTVVHPSSAMLADGLSTVLFILGREAGEKFLATWYPEARAIWIMSEQRLDRRGDGLIDYEKSTEGRSGCESVEENCRVCPRCGCRPWRRCGFGRLGGDVRRHCQRH